MQPAPPVDAAIVHQPTAEYALEDLEALQVEPQREPSEPAPPTPSPSRTPTTVTTRSCPPTRPTRTSPTRTCSTRRRVPAGDARARPAVVRAEASAGFRFLSDRLTWLDVFAPRPLAGNGLAVVHDADGVEAPRCRAFARETGLSETTFVQTATGRRAPTTSTGSSRSSRSCRSPATRRSDGGRRR